MPVADPLANLIGLPDLMSMAGPQQPGGQVPQTALQTPPQMPTSQPPPPEPQPSPSGPGPSQGSPGATAGGANMVGGPGAAQSPILSGTPSPTLGSSTGLGIDEQIRRAAAGRAGGMTAGAPGGAAPSLGRV